MTASSTLGKDLTGLEHMTPEQIRPDVFKPRKRPAP